MSSHYFVMSSGPIRRSKIYFQQKFISINDVNYFKLMIEKGVLVPTISAVKIQKSVVFYEMKIFDTNTEQDYDFHFVLPSEFSSLVRMQSLVSEDGTKEKVPVFDTSSSPEGDLYKSIINEILLFWLKKIAKASNYRDGEEEIPFTGIMKPITYFKWNWKTSFAEDYLDSFNERTDMHRFSFGTGYFAQDEVKCGTTFQLSNFPALTDEGIQEARMKRKRIRVEREEGEMTEETKTET
jgi:hypothetical protein